MPRTTPPTAATSSTTEVISKASSWSVRKSFPISAGLPNARSISASSESSSLAFRPSATIVSTSSARRRDDRSQLQPARPARPGRVRPAAEVGDHEEEHHHHRARVDEHLRGGDELGRGEQIEDGERGEVPDQRERGVERVREADDGDAGAEARAGGDQPDDPDQEIAHESVL